MTDLQECKTPTPGPITDSCIIEWLVDKACFTPATFGAISIYLFIVLRSIYTRWSFHHLDIRLLRLDFSVFDSELNMTSLNDVILNEPRLKKRVYDVIITFPSSKIVETTSFDIFDRLMDRRIDWLTHSLVDWLIDWLIDWQLILVVSK